MLKRKLGESIVIGTGPRAIVITVVEARGSEARLGITAPADVPIRREELVPVGARPGGCGAVEARP